MLLAEANQWPEDAVAYFGDGDECHMAFHFPLMPRLFMAIRMEDRFPIMEILQETPAIPANCQWALFLRNHDELTLEMVTDEERDYMYRVYAHDRRMRINLGIRRRLAPLLENDRRKIELMNALLFSLPGTPVIYYGDEIGMGDNIYLGDRNGVRTPMQWSADRNAGFSRANPQKLYLPIIIDPEYHYEAINVEAQQNNPHSLLWWMKRLIEQRKQFKAFGPGHAGVPASVQPQGAGLFPALSGRDHPGGRQSFALSAARGAGSVGVEGNDAGGDLRTRGIPADRRPAVCDHARVARLLLVFARSQAGAPGSHRRCRHAVRPSADRRRIVGRRYFKAEAWPFCCAGCPLILKTRRWFQGKNRPIRSIDVLDTIPIPDTSAQILLGQMEYTEGDPGDLCPARLGGRRRGGRAGESQAVRCFRGAVARPRTAREGSCTARFGIRLSATRCSAPSPGDGVFADDPGNWWAPTTARFARRGARAIPILAPAS